MAKAVFHKNQRVFVKPVGTWAVIEQVKPQWVKGVEEPLRIHYDVGLGRDFSADELTAQNTVNAQDGPIAQNWRILRAKNKWQGPEDSQHHPVPGTYPVVVTDEQDWGGWRVPMAEYDRDPARVEFQARVLSQSLALFNLSSRLVDFMNEYGEDAPHELMEMTKEAVTIIRYIRDMPPTGARSNQSGNDLDEIMQ